MAQATLPAVVGGVTLSPAQLSASREALVVRMDMATDRAMRQPDAYPSLPGALLSASCWLIAHGVVAPASRGETFFGWDAATCRQYLDGLDPAAFHDEMEAGEAALFAGRHPIARGVIDLARDLAEAGQRLATAEIVSLATAQALRDRWNANMDPAAVGAPEREAA